MSKNVEEEISIIITLYKTPIENIQLLNQYRNFRVLIFNQAEEDDSKKKLEVVKKFIQLAVSNCNIFVIHNENLKIDIDKV